MRIAAILWCAAIAGLQVYLFRRIREDLIKNHMEGPKGFRAMLAPWAAAGWVTIVEDEIRFWNGSRIYLCHCKDAKDVYKYQGAEIHVLLIDELTHFLEGMYRFLRNRVRMVGITLPAEYAGKFPRIMCGANPGNVGHFWVKMSFVDDGPMIIREMPANEGGMRRQYIPARLEDNPSMQDDDPGYEHRLEGLGSPAQVRAMRHGDWDIVEGAFFPEWRVDQHVLRPFAIPQHWARIRGFDWGSAAPFAVGWWAVASESVNRPEGLIPRGALIQYREWYGSSAPNVGLKLTAEAVADGIKERELKGEKIDLSVADPAIFAENGGPSIAERMGMRGVWWTPGDNKRVAQVGAIGGWDQVRGRLVGIDGRPMLYSFSTCTALNRTLPALQHDSLRPEDVDTDGEDHAPDMARYVCMSRPWTAPTAQKPKKRDMWAESEGDETNWRVA